MKKIKAYFSHLSKGNKILYIMASIGLILGLSSAIIAGGGFLIAPSAKTTA